MSATATLVPEFSIPESTTPQEALAMLSRYGEKLAGEKLAAPELIRAVGKAQNVYAEYVAALNALAVAEATKAAESNIGKSYSAVIITPKRLLSLNGVRSWPLPYYAEEWLQVFACRNAILSLIRDNQKTLAIKRPDEFSKLFDSAVNGDVAIKFNGVREAKEKREGRGS